MRCQNHLFRSKSVSDTKEYPLTYGFCVYISPFFSERHHSFHVVVYSDIFKISQRQIVFWVLEKKVRFFFENSSNFSEPRNEVWKCKKGKKYSALQELGNIDMIQYLPVQPNDFDKRVWVAVQEYICYLQWNCREIKLSTVWDNTKLKDACMMNYERFCEGWWLQNYWLA